MRHNKKFNHLSRKSAHRKAMLANMANSLILNKRITTTTAKAKALKIYVEPLITKAKEDSTHSRRIVFKYLQDKYAVSELFREISPKILDRPGGYTRILKTGARLGDNADMCILELVDYNDNYTTDKAAAKSKASRRSRRGSKKKSQDSELESEQVVAPEVSKVVDDIAQNDVVEDKVVGESEIIAESKNVEDNSDVKSVNEENTSEDSSEKKAE